MFLRSDPPVEADCDNIDNLHATINEQYLEGPQ